MTGSQWRVGAGPWTSTQQLIDDVVWDMSWSAAASTTR